ncbi:MAG: hypothetical protein LBD90_05735, partial [Bifidobacteriaceae bacterium]|nr:hypothetical protein [Bifidobacteriaceae bacterium]
MTSARAGRARLQVAAFTLAGGFTLGFSPGGGGAVQAAIDIPQPVLDIAWRAGIAVAVIVFTLVLVQAIKRRSGRPRQTRPASPARPAPQSALPGRGTFNPNALGASRNPVNLVLPSLNQPILGQWGAEAPTQPRWVQPEDYARPEPPPLAPAQPPRPFGPAQYPASFETSAVRA